MKRRWKKPEKCWINLRRVFKCANERIPRRARESAFLGIVHFAHLQYCIPFAFDTGFHFHNILGMEYHDRHACLAVKGKVQVIYIDIALGKCLEQLVQISDFIHQFHADYFRKMAQKTGFCQSI